jgi:glycosyltransferase involved in cell wall biosynthesis
LGNTGIQYLVLEESIRNTMRESLPFLSGRIEALDHPIPPNGVQSQISELNDPIRFGFLGFALKAKGFPLFVDVANAITSKYERRVEFHAIGRTAEDGSTVHGMEALATKPTRMQMTRNEFMTSVSQLHYIVLPHEPGPYALTASGVLLDAIALGKPVIARKIPIFESIFLKHGDIGYLFDKDSELRSVVEQILQVPDTLRYRRQVLNLRSLRKARDPEALAIAYREICRTHQGVLA